MVHKKDHVYFNLSGKHKRKEKYSPATERFAFQNYFIWSTLFGSPDYDQRDKVEEEVDPSAAARRWRGFATSGHTELSEERPWNVSSMHTSTMSDCVRCFWFLHLLY